MSGKAQRSPNTDQRQQPSQGLGDASRPRAAVFLDLENLLSDYRKKGDWMGAAVAVGGILEDLGAEADLVSVLACCDRRLARDIGPKLERFGVLTFAHDGGSEEADRFLLRLLDGLTFGCDIVVIGSGDATFGPVARKLKSCGKRIEIVAKAGTISAGLYSSATGFREFPASSFPDSYHRFSSG